MTQKVLSNKKNLIIFIISWLLITVSILVSMIAAEEADRRREVNVQELSLCAEPDKGSIINENVVKSNFDHLYICAKLTSNLNTALLGINVYKDSHEIPVFTNSGEDVFSPGFIYWEIPFTHAERIGSYRVDVYFFRNKVATMNFTIIDS